MQEQYDFNILNPNLDILGYVIAVANLNDKHDRSAPSDYHWKILKCRMMIFSCSSIMACPDIKDMKQVHIIFNKLGGDYDKLLSLFLTFSLKQNGEIRKTTPEIFQACFQYTMTAKIAPIWNILGCNYFINNRDFLTTSGPQSGIRFAVTSNESTTTLQIKPVKINLVTCYEDFQPGEWIRVLPSLNKAIIDDCPENLPQKGIFKSYKDLRRHWKNIYGYRLPEQESKYYMIRFWRGEPLTYPNICVIRSHPIITPVPKSTERLVLSKFINCLKNKMTSICGYPLEIQEKDINGLADQHVKEVYRPLIFITDNTNVLLALAYKGERGWIFCQSENCRVLTTGCWVTNLKSRMDTIQERFRKFMAENFQ